VINLITPTKEKYRKRRRWWRRDTMFNHQSFFSELCGPSFIMHKTSIVIVSYMFCSLIVPAPVMSRTSLPARKIPTVSWGAQNAYKILRMLWMIALHQNRNRLKYYKHVKSWIRSISHVCCNVSETRMLWGIVPIRLKPMPIIIKKLKLNVYTWESQ